MKHKLMLGRYIDGHSLLHRLDPRSKLAGMLLFMAAVFLINSYATLIIALAFTFIVIMMTRIPLSYYIKAVKPLLFLIAFIALFHIFFHAEGARLLKAGTFSIYSGGLEKGLVSAGRMTLFITFAAVLSFTTQPDRIAGALGSLLRPLQWIGLPIDRLVLMLSISLRFIPTIFEEAERIWKAQVSRGFSLTNRPLKEKAKLIIALLVPVTAGAFRRAASLADSMEARSYRLGAPRSQYRQMAWQHIDTLFLLSFALPITFISMLI